MSRTVRGISNLTGAAPDEKPQVSQVGRPRIRAESPLWTLRRSEVGRVVREPIPTQPQFTAPEPARLYEELDLSRDPDGQTLWCYMRPKGRPSFTPSLLRELIALRRSLQAHSERRGQLHWLSGGRVPVLNH